MLNGPRSGRSRLFALLAAAVALAVALIVFSRSSSSQSKPAAAQTSARGHGDSAAPREGRARQETPRPKTARSARESTRARTDDEEADSPPEPDDPAVRAVIAAAADDSANGTRTLIANLTSENEVVVAEAAKALVERRATEAISPLSKISLVSAAGSGLSIIDALGRLAAVADAGDKSVAVDRLLAMLAEEKERRAPESSGNLLQIYEALGQTRDPKAAPALEADLLDDTVPRAPKVVIVNAIVAIGQSSSRAALETARGQQTSAKATDAFEEEIRLELVGAIAKALESL